MKDTSKKGAVKTTAPKFRYIGPDYKNGIKIHSVFYFPKLYNDKERAAFLKQHPQFVDWWEEIPTQNNP
jgi:hypothetical protein